MKTTRSMIAPLALAMLTILGSCNASQQNEGEGHQKQQNEKKSEQVRTDKAEQPFDELQIEAQAKIKGSNSVGDQVPQSKVCMVNDAYMAKEQIAVPVQGKTYYGCCKMCVKTLNEQEDARVGTDPLTGEKVDKTEAYIVLLTEDGAVGYFRSKANYDTYASNAN